MKTETLFSRQSDEWETPQNVFDELDKEFHFTLDPCCTDENAKCAKHFTREQDGLNQDWSGETVFCNPPYSNVKQWTEKCLNFAIGGGTAVMLIPARTDTRWFHDFVYQKAEIRFVKGRIKFGGSINNAPFPSMIVIFRPWLKGDVID